MQKELSLITKKINKWIKQKKIVDIILFGSFMRGKLKPNDIDLCILIKDSDENKSLDLIDSLGKLMEQFPYKSQINILTLGSFVSGNTLAKTLLNEGYSIKKKQKFSAVFGFQSKSLFVYTLKHFTPSKRVQFHYLLKGRYGSKGILKEVNGKFLGAGAIMIPSGQEDTLKEIFEGWDIKYNIERLLLG